LAETSILERFKGFKNDAVSIEAKVIDIERVTDIPCASPDYWIEGLVHYLFVIGHGYAPCECGE